MKPIVLVAQSASSPRIRWRPSAAVVSLQIKNKEYVASRPALNFRKRRKSCPWRFEHVSQKRKKKERCLRMATSVADSESDGAELVLYYDSALPACKDAIRLLNQATALRPHVRLVEVTPELRRDARFQQRRLGDQLPALVRVSGTGAGLSFDARGVLCEPYLSKAIRDATAVPLSRPAETAVGQGGQGGTAKVPSSHNARLVEVSHATTQSLARDLQALQGQVAQLAARLESVVQELRTGASGGGGGAAAAARGPHGQPRQQWPGAMGPGPNPNPNPNPSLSLNPNPGPGASLGTGTTAGSGSLAPSDTTASLEELVESRKRHVIEARERRRQLGQGASAPSSSSASASSLPLSGASAPKGNTAPFYGLERKE